MDVGLEVLIKEMGKKIENMKKLGVIKKWIKEGWRNRNV
jgi:hypothetical protein